jgi:hypothetical protein
MPIVNVRAIAKPIATTDSLRQSTLRDFSGLWNTADNDLNLQPKFLSKLVNVERGTDGALKVRYGDREFCDISIPRHVATVTVHGVTNTNQLTVTWTAHGLSAGSQVRLTGLTVTSYMGLAASVLSAYLPVASIVDADNFVWQLPQFTSGAATDLIAGADEGAVTGNIIDVEYFETHLVVVTDTGYVASIDGLGAARVVWSPLINNIQTSTEQRTGVRLDTTIGSKLVRVESGFTPPPIPIGGVVQLTNYSDTGGIPATEINRQHIVFGINGTKYILQMGTTANLNTTSTGRLHYSLSAAWHSSFFCSHAVFNRQLLLFNGIDKPLFVDFEGSPVCQYLSDPATTSNINTPIGLYVAAGNDYVIVAGNAVEPGTIYISSKNTNCVFVGDAAPNDATNLDVGKLVNTPTPAITGLAFHRGLLFVSFENNLVSIKLGDYDASNNHIPAKQDIIENYGAQAHKSMYSIGKHFYLCDFVGVIDLQRNLLDAIYIPSRTSEGIAPHISKALSLLTGNQAVYGIWGLYDKRESRYWLHVPKPTGGYYSYVYTFLDERKVYGWQLFVDQDWTCGCRSEFDRIFGCKGTKVYIRGNDTDPLYTDHGASIRFIMETPWVDFNKRLLQKTSRYMSMDTDGTAGMTVEMFVDRCYENVAQIDADLAADPATVYDEFNLPTTPETSQTFRAAKSPGYSRGQQVYGGGRRTTKAGLVSCLATFNTTKIRITGNTDSLFKLVSLSVLYQIGSIRRGS